MLVFHGLMYYLEMFYILIIRPSVQFFITYYGGFKFELVIFINDEEAMLLNYEQHYFQVVLIY